MELPSHVDPAYISRAVRTLCVEGDVIEARVLGAPRAGHISGYFDDFDQLASAVARYDGQAEAAYFTLNPVQPALLARGNNRLVEWAKHATSDADILCRRWMMIDFDPARPAGISSSDAELQAALARREEVIEWLDLAGFTAGLCGMSGNGAHLLYRLDSLPNDEEHTALIQASITVIAARFSDKAVDIDRKVFNPSRLCKLYGTLVRKGENMPDRPHRRSYVDFPDALPQPLNLDQLRWLASQSAEPARVTVPRTGMQVTVGRRLDVPAYLAAAGLAEGRGYRVKRKKGMTWYNLRLCPVHADPHPNFECGLCQGDDGALGAKCQHDSSKTWRDFKTALGDPARFYVGDASSQSEPMAATCTKDHLAHGGNPSRQSIDSIPPTTHEIDLDEVLTFARCPTEHLWRYHAKATPPLNSDGLVREVAQSGLLRFYRGTALSRLEGVQSRWRERLDAWNIAKAFETLDTYARMRLEIMLPFLTGQIKKPNGELYRAPRMTEAYRNLYEQRGLLSLRAEIDRLAGGIPVVLDDESLADLFADTVEIALRFQQPSASDILGIQEPFNVSLPGGWALTGRADLVLSGDDDGKAILEVWDWSPVPSTWPILRRDLRIVAALHAHSGQWPAGVDRVRVRYLRTGEIVDVFGRTIPPWAQALLVTACRAMQEASTGVPRLAVSALQCKGCPYWAECASDGGWNILGTVNR